MFSLSVSKIGSECVCVKYIIAHLGGTSSLRVSPSKKNRHLHTKLSLGEVSCITA